MPMAMTTPKKIYRCQMELIRLAANSPKKRRKAPSGKSFRGPKRSISIPVTGENIA